MYPLGVITALKSEAACLRNILEDSRVQVFTSGMGADAATSAAQDAIERGCRTLISFGYAGALDPNLRSGDVIIGRSVSNGETSHMINPEFVSQLEATLADNGLADIKSGEFLSTPTVIRTTAEKARYAASGGWDAVDMESFSIESTAREHDLPVLIVRSILDTADKELPSDINTMTDSYGRAKLSTVITAVFSNPPIVSDLLSLAGARRLADRSLRGVAPSLVSAFTNG